MSIEFSTAIGAELSDAARDRVIDYLRAQTSYWIARKDDGSFSIGLIPPQSGPQGGETIALAFYPNRIYVAFHYGTRTDRQTFLQHLQNALSTESVASKFAEL